MFDVQIYRKGGTLRAPYQTKTKGESFNRARHVMYSIEKGVELKKKYMHRMFPYADYEKYPDTIDLSGHKVSFKKSRKKTGGQTISESNTLSTRDRTAELARSTAKKKVGGKEDRLFERKVREPLVDDEMRGEMIKSYETSAWFHEIEKRYDPTDSEGRIPIKMLEPYDCKVCGDRHVKLSNRQFLCKNNGKLMIVCHGVSKLIELGIMLTPSGKIIDSEISSVKIATMYKADDSDEALMGFKNILVDEHGISRYLHRHNKDFFWNTLNSKLYFWNGSKWSYGSNPKDLGWRDLTGVISTTFKDKADRLAMDYYKSVGNDKDLISYLKESRKLTTLSFCDRVVEKNKGSRPNEDRI